MTVQEFKEQHPHLAHLEGDALWDAMALAVPRVTIDPLPDDHEIAETIEAYGYTFNFTKGFARMWEKFMEGYVPPKLEKLYFFVPGTGEFTEIPNIKYQDDK